MSPPTYPPVDPTATVRAGTASHASDPTPAAVPCSHGLTRPTRASFHAVQITRIEHRANDTVGLFVEGEPEARLEVPLDVYLESGLAPGDELSAGRLDELRDRGEVARAREGALALLAHRARAREELRRRLRRKDFDDVVIDRVLAWLTDRGYVDDHAFAEAFVRDRLRLRPRGPFALARELRDRGVSPETAQGAIDRVMAAEGLDEADLVRDAAEAWIRKNRSTLRAVDNRKDRLRARRKLYGHLARRGFSGDLIRPAIERVLEDHAGGSSD